MAWRRSRGQPFDSNRQTVVNHSAAVSPLPVDEHDGRKESGEDTVAFPAMADPALTLG